MNLQGYIKLEDFGKDTRVIYSEQQIAAYGIDKKDCYALQPGEHVGLLTLKDGVVQQDPVEVKKHEDRTAKFNATLADVDKKLKSVKAMVKSGKLDEAVLMDALAILFGE